VYDAAQLRDFADTVQQFAAT